LSFSSACFGFTAAQNCVIDSLLAAARNARICGGPEGTDPVSETVAPAVVEVVVVEVGAVVEVVVEVGVVVDVVVDVVVEVGAVVDVVVEVGVVVDVVVDSELWFK